MEIQFFYEDIEKRIDNEQAIKKWLKNAAAKEGCKIDRINIIITSDHNLLEINQEFLSRNYYTDVITFDYSDGKVLRGEIYISYERVKDNANRYNNVEEKEMERMIIHGLLHMVGYNDKDKKEKEKMRKKEDEYLCLFK